jgi:hypothetical protein
LLLRAVAVVVMLVVEALAVAVLADFAMVLSQSLLVQQ